MKSISERIRDEFVNEIRFTRERIYPKPTQGLFNFRCFENSVQYAINSKKDLRIYEVFYIDGGYPVLHYLVKGDEYHEVTIGWRAEYVEYYLVREIQKEDWCQIGSIFEKAIEYWLREKTTWFQRKILGVDRVC